MFKKIISIAMVCTMLASFVPNVTALENAVVYGFEKKEEKWNIQATNGRIVTGFDTEIFRSGEQSYKFDAITLTEGENEISAISKTFDSDYKDAYKVGIWYLLSEDYTRLDAQNGGAFFEYTLLDKNGMEIPDSTYSYYISAPSYEDDIYSQHWSGNDFYIIPTKDTAQIRISIGIKAATGQVNFDDISFEKIDRKNVLSNPITTNQTVMPNSRDSYTYGWEGDEENWWGTNISKNAVAEMGVTSEYAHSGNSCYMFKADTLNVTAENNQQIINNKYNGSYFRVKPGVYDVSW